MTVSWKICIGSYTPKDIDADTDIASVNKTLSVLLNELDIYPIITTKGARHTYGSYLWHKGFDLGVIAKILGQISYRQAKKPYKSRLFPVDLDTPYRARTCDP